MRRALAALAAVLCGLSLSPGVARAEPSGLERAYQREFAYLKAEEAALTERLAATRAEGSARLGEARSALDALEARLLQVSRDADRLDDALSAAERSAGAAAEGDELIRGTLAQAASTLGMDPPAEGADPAAALPAAFASAAEAIARGGSLTVEPGAFFLADGARVEGQIIRLGRVASFGVSDAAAGPLAPAGEGRLRLFTEDAAARALVTGDPPPSLGLFLYESLDKRFEERASLSALQVVQAGGVVAWVIVALGAVASLLVLIRALTLAAAWASTRRLTAAVDPLLAAGRIADARARCAEGGGPGARVLGRLLGHLGEDAERLESAATEAILHEAPAIERFGSTISVLAAVAPLLGLLGTVTGIIATFDIITELGTGDPKLLSGGISEALITTELGLIVAIPTLLIGSLLTGRAEALMDQLELMALKVAGLGSGPLASAPPAERPEPAAAALHPMRMIEGAG